MGIKLTRTEDVWSCIGAAQLWLKAGNQWEPNGLRLDGPTDGWMDLLGSCGAGQWVLQELLREHMLRPPQHVVSFSRWLPAFPDVFEWHPVRVLGSMFAMSGAPFELCLTKIFIHARSGC